MSGNLNTKVSLDDRRWVIEIRHFFEEEDADDGNDVVVCIFRVPNALKAIKPEAYSPQLIALGPYHHWREDLYKLEKYKLVTTKRVQAQFKTLKLPQLVDKLMKMDAHIRACYHRFFDMDGETLAWLMTIDGIFLLHFLHTYVDKKSLARARSPRLTRLFIGSGAKNPGYESIFKDVMMLENQIPTIVLRKIMQVVHCTSVGVADDLLSLILMGVCKQISPLKINEDYPHPKVIGHCHLIDLLYHLIVPKQVQLQQQSSEDLEIKSKKRTEHTFGEEAETLSWVWKLLSKFNIGIIRKINLLIMIPIKMISRVKVASNAASTLEKVLPFDHEEARDIEMSDQDHDHKAPLVEEIMIPSVTDLSDAGVEFCPSEGGIMTIKFDSKARKFYLPVIHLDGDTEVVMRNLVAYEELAALGPLVLARYTELLNGIIDTSEDAKLLREKKIIVNRLKSDREVADLWNGMSRAIRLTTVPFIDKAIVEANLFYENTPKRKFRNMIKKYIYSSWKILIVVATILLFVLVGLQSVCSVFNCGKQKKWAEPEMGSSSNGRSPSTEQPNGTHQNERTGHSLRRLSCRRGSSCVRSAGH